ncbi:MAG: ATP-NAD kinase family protein [Nitrospinota bacterium]
MGQVGIIVNPEAGKDIRRLVAMGISSSHSEKVNILRRVLTGLDAVGMDEVLLMPEAVGIGPAALGGLGERVREKVRFIPMRTTATAEDSTRAARLMRERGVRCIITVGGDGTCRAVAKEAGDVALLPISTGTNNVFPKFIEGTVAGMAAGLFALKGELSPFRRRAKRLEVLKGGSVFDIALIDAAFYDAAFQGSRAIWELERVRGLVLTQGLPSSIGLSAIGGFLEPVGPWEERGLYLRFAQDGGGLPVMAPIGPGLLAEASVEEVQALPLGTCVAVEPAPCMLALDGEREIYVGRGEEVRLRLSGEGPWVLDLEAVLKESAEKGLLRPCD